MPTFTRTFDVLRSVIDITLTTASLRDESEEHPSKASEAETAKNEQQDEHASATTVQAASSANGHTHDISWEEFQLELRPQSLPQAQMPSRGRREYFRHRGVIPLDLELPRDVPNVKHYTDPGACAPILSLAPLAQPDFQPLGTGLRDEKAEELLVSRFGVENNSARQKGRPCSRTDIYVSHPCPCADNGGGWMHAAKIWQGIAMRGKEGEEARAGQSHGQLDSKQQTFQV